MKFKIEPSLGNLNVRLNYEFRNVIKREQETNQRTQKCPKQKLQTNDMENYQIIFQMKTNIFNRITRLDLRARKSPDFNNFELATRHARPPAR